VDPLSRRQFWEILLDLRNRGGAMLVSTPYMDEAARCDRACFILGGRKLSEDTPGGLAAQFSGSIYYLDRTLTAPLTNQLNAIDGLRARRFGAGLHVYIDASEQLERYGEALGRLGIDTAELHRITPDLEDRFIQLMEAQ
jgi:ABC-type multidrug transport system ATPase subunit